LGIIGLFSSIAKWGIYVGVLQFNCEQLQAFLHALIGEVCILNDEREVFQNMLGAHSRTESGIITMALYTGYIYSGFSHGCDGPESA
jgi:hypothetical protein